VARRSFGGADLGQLVLGLLPQVLAPEACTLVSFSRMRLASAGESSLTCMPFCLSSASALAASSRVSLRSKSRLLMAASCSTFFSAGVSVSHHFLLTETIQGL
jgi:hypothetical protein